MTKCNTWKWPGIALGLVFAGLAAISSDEVKAQATQVGATTKPIMLVYAGYLPAADPGSQIVKKFAQLTEERSAGRVKVDLHFDGQLGNERESTEGVRNGTVDLVSSLGTGLTQYVPAVSTLELPYLAKSGSEATKLFLNAMPEVAVLSKSSGFYPLTVWDLGPRCILSKKPIRHLEDMKGVRIRAPAPVYIGTMQAFGANPIQMAWGEIYTALQTGAIDAMEGSPQQIYASKFQEQAKYLLVSKHMIPGHYLLISRTKWDSFPADVQELLKKAANDAAADTWAGTDAAFDATLAKLKAEGVTVTYPDDMDKWVAAVQPFRRDYAAKLGKGAEDLLEHAKAPK